MWQREKEKEIICKEKKGKEITRNSVEKGMSRPKIK